MIRHSLLLLSALASICSGFVGFPALAQRRPTVQSSSQFSSTQPEDIVELKADIERMRAEASMRLEALNEKLVVVASKQKKQKHHQAQASHNATTSQEVSGESINATATAVATAVATTVATTAATASNNNPSILASLTAPKTSSSVRPERVNLEDFKTMENLTEIAEDFERDMEFFHHKRELQQAVATQKALSQQGPHPLKLLDGTTWRVVLNVFRVKGTWMPKTWGASGDHLHLKLEVEFSTDELYEREDFFNGLSDGSKVLKIANAEASLGPTLTEAARTVKVVNGGWKVCPQEGPLGTAILRWYFDIEEEARHLGSDVYVPAGRVYGTCGYFPMTGRSNVDGKGNTKREVYQQELRQMEVKYMALQEEMNNDPDFISMDKIQRFQQMREIKQEARKVKRTIDDEKIREPTKDKLRLSRDQSVGLTHEGGLCCKKQNGLSQEYHILGKFESASIDNRKRSDYRDLLRP